MASSPHRSVRCLPGRPALTTLAAFCSSLLVSCAGSDGFNAATPARGPGEFVGRSTPLNDTFAGGVGADYAARSLPMGEIADWRACGTECQAHCAAQTFNNPLDEAMCPHLWGAGLDTRPVDEHEACRRMYVDLAGYFPTLFEIERSCLGRPADEVALRLIASDEFVRVNQLRWSDRLRYDNISVNFERIFDADETVGKAYRGLIRYDELVEVMSAHPVLTRRFDNAGDRAEALFTLFLGRPPFDNERADMAKLYRLWNNHYVDHPQLGLRLPDAFIQHACVDERGEIDPNTQGQCTSLLWGYNQVIIEPDFRAIDGRTWSENLTEAEWRVLQTPGRILSVRSEAWEYAVADVLEQYLGYNLSFYAPSVLQPLVEYLFAHGGDIRSIHYVVATSQLYRQSTTCPDDVCGDDLNPPAWTYGALKQVDSQVWLDTLSRFGSSDIGRCDRRLPSTRDFMQAGVYGIDVLANSEWTFNDEGVVDERYRNVARTLGGCPDNQVTTRFQTISILNTATQESFVAEMCNPGGASTSAVESARILPETIAANRALDDTVAEEVVEYQVRTYFGRPASTEERDMARVGGAACVPQPCDAETFARVLCYALLSSGEMLFY
ncbi:MAG: hypothetical protein H6726_29245 [Sandaracinaceae bacterium]|nr:hypothetical protein [Myxococcales bacterium]MCB9661764.1 hypothetical protein [Sandaracinaceae bacterium]